MIQGWKCYEHALIPEKQPHESISSNMQEIKKELNSNKYYFARWTTNYDCSHKTQWWFCIRDEKIDINSLKSKQRYRINKGLKYMRIEKINPNLYIKQIFDVAYKSFAEYPKIYRPNICFSKFKDDVKLFWSSYDCFACFDKENDILCAYSLCKRQDNMVYLNTVKVDPEYLNKEVNAALVYYICHQYLNIDGCAYICDGERNIRHQTNYQKFLVDNLGFRYAYCKLNIIYPRYMKILISILFPLRYILKSFASSSPFLYNVSTLLKQEEIRRSFL